MWPPLSQLIRFKMESRKPNRLSTETSPYLKQHALNPVDWFAWGKTALEKAQRENKPIFLSIGYSACHWCHVMERESFEDPETAALMNKSFINIKVDREERPDLDHIYMAAVQIMTNHGGWPMSVFLTPRGEPFYGGTYFPPEDRMGLPSFKKILQGVSHAWATREKELLGSATELTAAIRSISESVTPTIETLNREAIEAACRHLVQAFDSEYGGFGGAPKFFHTMDLRVLLRNWFETGNRDCLNVVTHTLDQISLGGVYDWVGGGFHRYSTDREWLVPHFEKMLYDNALLAEVYVEAYQITRSPRYARIASQTLDYILKEMTAPGGGFYCTQDADSEGVEGKFYVWGLKDIEDTLGTELTQTFLEAFPVKSEGNWEHTNILRMYPDYAERDWLEDPLALARRKLYQKRSERIAPFKDEKIIVSWNGLTIHSLALSGRTLEDAKYLTAAQKGCSFILDHLYSDSQGLPHSFKDGQSKFPGFLDDYACIIQALLGLYEADLNPQWIRWAERLTEEAIDRFWVAPAFYFTSKNHEKLILRPKENHDGAIPSATAMMIYALLRVGRLLGNQKYLGMARTALETAAFQLKSAPTASGQLLLGLDLCIGQTTEIALCGGENAEELDEYLNQLSKYYLPRKMIAGSGPLSLPLLEKRTAIDSKTTAFLCYNQTCTAPIRSLETLNAELSKLMRPFA